MRTMARAISVGRCIRNCIVVLGATAASAVCLLASVPVLAKGIHVISGTYGGNCKDRLTGDKNTNKTEKLKEACEGRDVCEYSVVWQDIGDPAYGCKKDYVAVWQCEQGGGGTAIAEPEAGYGSKVVLSCK